MIDDLVEELGRRAPHQPDAGDVGRNRERQQQRPWSHVHRVELAEHEIGHHLERVATAKNSEKVPTKVSFSSFCGST